jgi:hypothetical protein
MIAKNKGRRRRRHYFAMSFVAQMKLGPEARDTQAVGAGISSKGVARERP